MMWFAIVTILILCTASILVMAYMLFAIPADQHDIHTTSEENDLWSNSATYKGMIRKGFTAAHHKEHQERQEHRHCWCPDEKRHPGCFHITCDLCRAYQRWHEAFVVGTQENAEVMAHVTELSHIVGF